VTVAATPQERLERREERLKLLVPARFEELRDLPIFGGVPAKARDKILEKVRKYMYWVDFADRDVILREGDYSDSAFFIARGRVEVQLASAAREATSRQAKLTPQAIKKALFSKPKAAAEGDGMLGRGASPADRLGFDFRSDDTVILSTQEIFGEMSALSRFPISASVRAVGSVTVLKIQLPGLRMLMAASPDFRQFLNSRYRERTLARHLRAVGLFADVSPTFIDDLKNRAELLSFEPDQIVVEEGAAAEAFYLVRGGYVKVSVHSGDAELAVTYLRRGDYAGEVALLLDEKWPFSLRALDYVELVKITKGDFKQLLESSPRVSEILWDQITAMLKVRGAVTRNPVSSEYVQMAMESGLIHGESVLLMDLSTCTRCDDCVRGCAEAHEGEPKFVREGSKYRHWLIPTACYQCSDPVCMIDCPTGAISRDAGSLEVTINPATCIGCTNCADRCPWDNIVMVETGEVEGDGRPKEIATKCDLCLDRPDGPACVQQCPHGSAIRISFKNMDTVRTTMTPAPNIVKPKDPRNLKLTGAAAVLLVAIYFGASRAWSWTPGHGLGLAFGILASALFVLEMLYAGRRKLNRPFRTAKSWLQAHVYLGLIGFVAMAVHGGFRWPTGLMGWSLWVLSTWTVATGLIGVWLQKWLPAAIADGLKFEALYERIPVQLEKLVAEADVLLEGAGEVLVRFYQNDVRPTLTRPRVSWSYVFNVRAGRERAIAPFRRLGQFLGMAEKEKLEDLIQIYTEKLELDAHYTLQRILRDWLILHVPPAGLLLGLMVVHIFAWIWY